MLLVNPYTGKTVDAGEGVVGRLIEAGFRPVEPPTAPLAPAEPAPKRRPGRPRKSE